MAAVSSCSRQTAFNEEWAEFTADRIRPDDDWASLIFIRIFPDGTFDGIEKVVPEAQPTGYIFVIEPERSNPKFKCAGGHKAPRETPLQTALRELVGETGLIVSPEALGYAGSDWRKRPSPHWSCLFIADLEESDVPWMHTGHEQNEGEVPTYLTVAQLAEAIRKGQFLDYHYHRLNELGYLRELDR